MINSNDSANVATTATLQTESLSKTFTTRTGQLVILRDVSLSLSAGDSAAIMGPSGSGKSTLLNILGTLETPTTGRVLIDGVDPFAASTDQLAHFRNRNIGFVFQEHHLLPQCSVLENVLLPTLADKNNPCGDERARSLLERVGLTDRIDHRPAELSGGERQRVAIARALINQPSLLLADEPTGNLDRATAETVADLLLEIHREERTILIVVTHSQTLASRFPVRWELADAALEIRK
jgi:lipoprotein-releasing system ATP-binding protein